MNRLLTILSAAVFLAVNSTPSVLAGDVEPWPNGRSPAFDTAREQAADLPTGQPLLRKEPPPAAGISAPQGENDPSLVDVSDFISPAWTQMDASVKRLSEPVADITPLLAADSSAVASSDVNTLSVPEVPLPPTLIPAFAGVVFVYVLHRKSLKHGKLPR